jgi:hypothetical protein
VTSSINSAPYFGALPFGEFSEYSGVGGAISLAPGTQFGIPAIDLSVSGLFTSAFGTPVGGNVYPPTSLGVVTKFGTPITDADQTVYAQGFYITRFSPWVYSTLGPPPAAHSFAVSGFQPVNFGTPVGKANRTAVATGFTAVHLGAPVSVRGAVASGFTSTHFGTAKQVTKTYGSGFSSTCLGTPASSRTAPATSVYRATRFGLPVAVRSNCYYPYGLYSPARFGQHKMVADLHTESGFTGTAFGTPAMQLRYRALHIPPVAAFGKPLAQRTPLC